MYLQSLARGEGYRQLRPLEDALQFEKAMELEYPVELLEPLSFILGRLLNEVCRRLGARSLANNEIRLQLTLENAPEHLAVLRLPVPMLDPAAFLKMLQLELNGRPPVAAVLKAALVAEPVKPRRTQQGLFVSLSPEPEKLELTIARIRHLTGPDKVGTAELVNTHRPDSFSHAGVLRRGAVKMPGREFFDGGSIVAAAFSSDELCSGDCGAGASVAYFITRSKGNGGGGEGSVAEFGGVVARAVESR